MPGLKDLPYLLELLDDESHQVQEMVVKELLAFGPSLKRELDRLSISLNIQQNQILKEIFESQQRTWLRQNWSSWFPMLQDNEKLEKALCLLAEFQSGDQYREKLSTLLDQLAQEFESCHSVFDAQHLAQFLFQTKGLKGNTEDYYNPQNSNLIYVIKEKRGIPISLAIIYILVGRRIGLTIEGCNLPGHFMASIHDQGRKLLVDCFNAGRMIDRNEIIATLKESSPFIAELIDNKADAETIIGRVLSNLIRAYESKDNIFDTQLILDLMKDLQEYQRTKESDSLNTHCDEKKNCS